MVQLLFIGLTVLANILVFNYLPAQVPTHWGVTGQVDAYMAKEIGIWVMPGLSLALTVFFKYLPQFDPKNKNYTLFAHEWNIIQISLVGFLSFMHFLILYFSFNPNANFLSIFFVGLGVFFVLLGNYLSKIRQNYFIGVRTPWTLDSTDNWNKTHRYASWCFVIIGIFIIIEAFTLWLPPIFVILGIIILSILPMIYSFLLFKKAEYLMKMVHWVLLGLILSIFLVKGISAEDSWTCQKGQWIKHGNPSSQMPIEKCK